MDTYHPIASNTEELVKLDERTRRVTELSLKLCAIPGISMPDKDADFENILKSHEMIKAFLEENSLDYVEMELTDEKPYPQLMVMFRESEKNGEKVALVGHYDVVPPKSEGQFEPRLDSDGKLHGRASADMKTVVATQLVWMAEQQAKPGKKPPFVLMLSGCEENGSVRGNNMKDMMQVARKEFGMEFGMAIVGERTGELEHMDADIKVGPICEANRGWRWYRGEQSKEGENGMPAFFALSQAIADCRALISNLNADRTSQRQKDQSNWKTGFVNSFVRVGSDLDMPSDGTLVRMTSHGKSKHSGAFNPDRPTFLEELIGVSGALSAEFGEENLSLRQVVIGEDENYNSVTGGGTVEFVVSGSHMAVVTVLGGIISEQLNHDNHAGHGIEFFASPESNIAKVDTKPLIGIDLREIPEHTQRVNEMLESMRNVLRKVGVDLTTVNDGDGWEIDHENLHFQKLRESYESVIGKDSPALGKLHGNDGRFFDGRAIVWGQVGSNPHGPKEFHQVSSIVPYMDILDRMAGKY
ncbi:MAG: M20/M25/M40 family metallo-hydrolase [Candidatus Gracilibacteria bacterium]|nr:M20/M25/M40 family metallo-hydrolase [Candidatus Gracilibacteria bacterium]